jgi:hypothetical protein
MKATAKKLQDSGLATFSPHYILFACPLQYVDTPECQSQCILKGAFCAQDPDGSVAAGYAGLDVLKVTRLLAEEGLRTMVLNFRLVFSPWRLQMLP